MNKRLDEIRERANHPDNHTMQPVFDKDDIKYLLSLIDKQRIALEKIAEEQRIIPEATVIAQKDIARAALGEEKECACTCPGIISRLHQKDCPCKTTKEDKCDCGGVSGYHEVSCEKDEATSTPPDERILRMHTDACWAGQAYGEDCNCKEPATLWDEFDKNFGTFGFQSLVPPATGNEHDIKDWLRSRLAEAIEKMEIDDRPLDVLESGTWYRGYSDAAKRFNTKLADIRKYLGL